MQLLHAFAGGWGRRKSNSKLVGSGNGGSCRQAACRQQHACSRQQAMFQKRQQQERNGSSPTGTTPPSTVACSSSRTTPAGISRGSSFATGGAGRTLPTDSELLPADRSIAHLQIATPVCCNGKQTRGGWAVTDGGWVGWQARCHEERICTAHCYAASPGGIALCCAFLPCRQEEAFLSHHQLAEGKSWEGKGLGEPAGRASVRGTPLLQRKPRQASEEC